MRLFGWNMQFKRGGEREKYRERTDFKAFIERTGNAITFTEVTFV